MPQNQYALVWMDLEMTGLNPNKDHIIEMATIITDSELNIVSEGPVIAIHSVQAYTCTGSDDPGRCCFRIMAQYFSAHAAE